MNANSPDPMSGPDLSFLQELAQQRSEVTRSCVVYCLVSCSYSPFAFATSLDHFQLESKCARLQQQVVELQAARQQSSQLLDTQESRFARVINTVCLCSAGALYFLMM